MMTPDFFLNPEDLATMIGTPHAPAIVDVCLPEDHALDPRIIPASRRMTHEDAAKDPDLGRSRPAVILCQKGLKLSQGAAGILRADGRQVRVLRGGHQAWAAAGFPLIPMGAAPGLGGWGQRWFTPLDPEPVDLFHAWITARFIDPQAQWCAVERAMTGLSAARFSGQIPQCADAWQGPLGARLKKVQQICDAPPVSALLAALIGQNAQSLGFRHSSFALFDAGWALSAGDAS